MEKQSDGGMCLDKENTRRLSDYIFRLENWVEDVESLIMINPLPPTVSLKTRRPTLKSMGRGWGMVIKKPRS